MKISNLKFILLIILAFNLINNVIATELVIEKKIKYIDEFSDYSKDIFDQTYQPEHLEVSIDNNMSERVVLTTDDHSIQKYASGSINIESGQTYRLGIEISGTVYYTNEIRFEDHIVNHVTINGTVSPLNLTDSSGKELSRFHLINENFEAVSFKVEMGNIGGCVENDANFTEFTFTDSPFLSQFIGDPIVSPTRINCGFLEGTAYIDNSEIKNVKNFQLFSNGSTYDVPYATELELYDIDNSPRVLLGIFNIMGGQLDFIDHLQETPLNGRFIFKE